MTGPQTTDQELLSVAFLQGGQLMGGNYRQLTGYAEFAIFGEVAVNCSMLLGPISSGCLNYHGCQ